jgi:hypothetical protein
MTRIDVFIVCPGFLISKVNLQSYFLLFKFHFYLLITHLFIYLMLWSALGESLPIIYYLFFPFTNRSQSCLACSSLCESSCFPCFFPQIYSYFYHWNKHKIKDQMWNLPSLFSFFFFFFIMLGLHCGVCKSSYNIYHTSIHPLHHSPIIPHPISGTVSAGLIFTFAYMCTQYLHHIHPPTPFPNMFPTHIGYRPPDRSCSALLFSDFVKEKKKTFLLV